MNEWITKKEKKEWISKKGTGKDKRDAEKKKLMDKLTGLGHSLASLAGKSLAALQKMLRSDLEYAKTGIGVEKKKRVSDKKKYKTMTAATQKTGGVIKRRGGGIAKRGFGIAK